MIVRGVASTRVLTAVPISPKIGETGELDSPARTDTRTSDIPVDVTFPDLPNWSPRPPSGLDVWPGGVVSASGTGAGGHSQQRGQGQGDRPPAPNTVVISDGAGNRYEIDMGKPSQQRIGGLVIQASGPETTIQKVIGGVKRLLGL